MCGDHGIGECYDSILELPKCIAKGDDVAVNATVAATAASTETTQKFVESTTKPTEKVTEKTTVKPTEKAAEKTTEKPAVKVVESTEKSTIPIDITTGESSKGRNDTMEKKAAVD